MITYDDINCPCGFEDVHKNTKFIIQCNNCKSWQHKSCIKTMTKMHRYLCPNCQIKNGALFYNILYTLIEPSLFEISGAKETRMFYTFIPDIKKYSEFNKIISDNYHIIIFRCLLFDENGFNFHWPKMCKIFLNNKLILDLTKKGYKKKDKTIVLIPEKDYDKNINKKYFLYDSNIIKIEDYIYDKKPNRIEICVNYNDDIEIERKNYAISMDCVEILKDTDEIIKNIPIYNDKQKLIDLISSNQNNINVLSVKEKIDLLDIYTDTEKIKIPVRGINCCHLNVFDLNTFLILNRKTNKYQCPYCKRYANILYIDGIIYDFIKDPKNEKINEIFMDKDLNIFPYINSDISSTQFNSVNSINSREDDYSIINKKYGFDLDEEINDIENNNHTRRFSNISNLGEIFNQIREEIINKNNPKNKNRLDKKGKKNYSQNLIHIFPKDKTFGNVGYLYNDIKENEINEELYLPAIDEKQMDEKKSDKKEHLFLQKKTRDYNFDNILHPFLFSNISVESSEKDDDCI